MEQEKVKCYRIPVYKSEEEADRNIFHVMAEETWEDLFCGTYNECCEFISYSL